jgi:hypothetical protein
MIALLWNANPIVQSSINPMAAFESHDTTLGAK